MPDRRMDASSSHSNDSNDCILLKPRLLRFSVCSRDDGVALGVLAASSSSSGIYKCGRVGMTIQRIAVQISVTYINVKHEKRGRIGVRCHAGNTKVVDGTG